EVAADAGGEIGADLLHVQSHGCDLVVIENDLGLRLIDLGVDVAELEDVRRHRFLENLFGELENPLLISGRGDDKTDREIVRTWKRGRHDGKHLDSRNRAEFLLHDRQIILCRRLTCAPWLQDHSAEAAVWKRELESE